METSSPSSSADDGVALATTARGLPPGWQQITHQHHRERPCYVHAASRVVSWTRPYTIDDHALLESHTPPAGVEADPALLAALALQHVKEWEALNAAADGDGAGAGIGAGGGRDGGCRNGGSSSRASGGENGAARFVPGAGPGFAGNWRRQADLEHARRMALSAGDEIANDTLFAFAFERCVRAILIKISLRARVIVCSVASASHTKAVGGSWRARGGLCVVMDLSI